MYKTNSHGGVYAPGKPIRDKVRSKIIDFFAQGFTYSEIAREVRVDSKTCKKLFLKVLILVPSRLEDPRDEKQLWAT